MTGNQADVIPGFMIDERLIDRAEVILIVTGLGGTAVDSSIFSSREKQAAMNLGEGILEVATDMGFSPASTISTPEQASQSLPDLPDNLELPAFLRRRNKIPNGS